MTAGHDDTIVAAGSPPGRSPRGLVRISGPNTRDILTSLLYPGGGRMGCTDTGKARSQAPLPSSPKGEGITPVPRTLIACHLRTPPCTGTLPALAAFFPAPRSYTGQDMSELQCPGNPALLDRLIHAIVAAGARLAEPGEFTFRAFLAGKLDLTQAEGVAATIAATSEGQLQAATLLREGRLGAFAADLVDQLSTRLALVEAGIDFVDQDDVVPIAPARLGEDVAAIAALLDDLLSHSRSWGAIEALPRVVLAGVPSAGKSTLFNALLGRQRAVISPAPGTTRDVLAEPLTLRAADGRDVEVMLVDIAGLDEPGGALDEQVQAAARGAIARADLVLRVFDRAGDDSPLPPAAGPALRVRTKIDANPMAPSEPRPDAAVSAVTGAGLDALRRLIAHHVGRRGVSLAAHQLALQPRHEAALRSAAAHLARARAILAPQTGNHAIARIELVAAALRAALDELSCLGGSMTPDDVIGKVFAKFCIGK